MSLDWDQDSPMQWWGDDSFTSGRSPSASSGGSPLTPASELSDAGLYPPSLFYTGDENTTCFGDYGYPDTLGQVPDDMDYSTAFMTPNTFPYSDLSTPRPRDTDMTTREATPRYDSQTTATGAKKAAASSKASRTSDRKPPSRRATDDRAKLRTSHQQLKKPTAAAPAPDMAASRTTSQVRQQARHSHNQVERKYRLRLNDQFERLLAVLHAHSHSHSRTASSSSSRGGGAGDDDLLDDDDDEACGGAGGVQQRSLSKSSVLELARRRLVALERENKALAGEVEQLRRGVLEAAGGRFTVQAAGGRGLLGMR